MKELVSTHRFILSMVSLQERIGTLWKTQQLQIAVPGTEPFCSCSFVRSARQSFRIDKPLSCSRGVCHALPSLGLEFSFKRMFNCPVLSVSTVSMKPPAMWIEAAFVQTLPFPGPSIEAITETGSSMLEIESLSAMCHRDQNSLSRSVVKLLSSIFCSFLLCINVSVRNGDES